MAQNITLLGASYADVPAVTLPKTGGGEATFTDVTPTTAAAADVASGKMFFDALGVLTQGTASGGGGGASNVVTGTFKGTTTNAAMDVNLAYTGSGYPIAWMIYPSEGTYNSSGTFYALVQRYALVMVACVKTVPNTTPTYPSDVDSATDNDKATILYRYKNSTSSSTSYSQSSVTDPALYLDKDAASINNQWAIMRSNKKMSVFITGRTYYGFSANIEYTYCVIYSS